jgi:NAD(P)-dependent dehydrogenase (short-subunit alcohol dehydrogenase family)
VGLEPELLEEVAADCGPDTVWAEADVRDADALESAVDVTAKLLGGIDVVVANAGVAPSPRSILSSDPEEFEHTVDVDLLGQWRTMRATLPALIERRGHVVVIASIYSFVNGMLNAPYAASKAGVEQLVRALRVEAAPYGVTAGAAYLGFVDTELADEAFATEHVAQARGALPAFVTRAIPVADASRAVLDGVERRRASITAPEWVLPALAARSVLTVVDEYLMRSRAVLDAVRRSDREAQRERT